MALFRSLVNHNRSAILYALLYLLIASSCDNQTTLFKKLDSSRTGIYFNNAIRENDSINPIDLEFLYNGGGVAAGDFNNDNLTDLYFTASTGSNKLYLNKGHLSFLDVTSESGVSGSGEWSNGVSVIDINNDGLLDIYVCTTIKSNPQERRNLLYINKGINSNNVPVFTEMAREYGLADTSFAVQAAFLDYDHDGDLDMYLVTTKLARRDGTSIQSNRYKKVSAPDVDKLFRNDWSDSLKHPVFTDVSSSAGINEPGFGLGVTAADINKDGWMDIYVTNDYFNSDHLYINNRNGTFSDRIKDYFRHTSQNAMGNDIADINNDGLPDIVAVDMNPEDNFRKKKNLNGNNYYLLQRMKQEKLMLQYVRNTLQLNMGPRMLGNDSVGEPVFSDISFYAGVAETDWSWNPLIADFDNDGNRDILITNGYPKDVTDHDFLSFSSISSDIASKEQLIEQMPQIKVANYAFRNLANLKFQNATAEWGLSDLSFSNGAIYADLDNDGDLDYVINNINEEAFVYENTLNHGNVIRGNYLNVTFRGGANNVNGLGATAVLYYDNKHFQYFENCPVRGYLSCVETKAFFGLGSSLSADSLIIRWPSGETETLRNIKANQVVEVNIKNAKPPAAQGVPVNRKTPVFTDITASSGIDYLHHENDFIDFDYERLIPHKLSQSGPGLAAADIDGNGLDDICIGGSSGFPGKFFLQQPGGKFNAVDFRESGIDHSGSYENMGLLFFDADGDGDEDLFCASGSNEFPAGSPSYSDMFYLNDGHGHFTNDSLALPNNQISKSCVKAADYDGDGDLDLFIGGRSYPGKYPEPVSSFIYRNDLNRPEKKFTDVTAQVAGTLLDVGMVCDAIWTDFDNDGYTDLILAGEWMPLTFLKNQAGKLINVTARSGIENETGWWNSITGGDFDNDGDIDYIAGNLGLNSFFRASAQYPVQVYVKDFDKNGKEDAILTVYLKDQNGDRKEYPAANRDDFMAQLPSFKKKFLTYKDFGKSSISEIFTTEELKNARTLKATNFSSSYIENKGNGKFEMHSLPELVQMAPVNGMVTEDFNADGNLDLAICGNDYGNEPVNGQYDAMNGLVLLGNGSGSFTAQTILQSGLYIPGDAKALIKLRAPNGSYLIAASQNNGALKIFQPHSPVSKVLSFNAQDKNAIIPLANGKTRKEELYYGNSYLSQSSRFITTTDSSKVRIFPMHKQ